MGGVPLFPWCPPIRFQNRFDKTLAGPSFALCRTGLLREVRANLPYRRVRRHRRRESAGCEGTGDWDKPSGRSNRASGAWCKEEGATVVETNIHTAIDTCLLGMVRAC